MVQGRGGSHVYLFEKKEDMATRNHAAGVTVTCDRHVYYVREGDRGGVAEGQYRATPAPNK